MATLSDMNEWERCVTSVQLTTRSLYFCSKRLVEGGKATARTDGGNLSTSFPSRICFEFVSPNDSIPGVDTFYRSACRAVEQFHLSKRLEANKEIGFLPCYTFAPGDLERSCRKSFAVHSLQSSTDDTQRFVVSVAKSLEQAVYIKYEVEEDEVYKKVISLATGEQVANCQLVEVLPPECPPILDTPTTHCIFHSKSKVEEILSKELHLEGIDELWRIAAPLLGRDVERTSPVHDRKSVIVVEGLDGIGKSLLCKKLSKAINAQQLGTPPKCLSHLRDTFDRHPPMIRRAYYSLGNYLAAQEIAEAARTSPVVLDRFWHSSSAYAIATEIGSGGSSQLPGAGHPIYQWPQDLLKPDIAVLLVVRPEIRLQRIQSRGGRVTEEEKLIERNPDFQERVLESYKRMREPVLQVVDASGTPDKVLQAVIHLLRSKGLINDREC